MLTTMVFNALHNPGSATIFPGIDRISHVLEHLDNPQHNYKVIHITGTNGKGSTAAFIETGLIHAGYKTGKFSSPHIKFINECISLNHQPISDLKLEEHYWEIKKVLDTKNITLSPFELLTTIMFCYFAACEIDYLVLEVGMGGKDDSTNVVNSQVTVITNIGLEHTNFLGNTLEQIAEAKSGIIKDGLTIIADWAPELLQAVKNKTTNFINVLDYYNYTVELDYTQFKTLVELNQELYTLNLFGKFQAYNFLCAYHVFSYLNIPKSSIRYSASHTSNPGRLEVREKTPLLILDATHNLSGAKSLRESIEKQFSPSEVVIITSIMADKDVAGMLKEFAAISTSIICTSVTDNQRALRSKDLAFMATKDFITVATVENPDEALKIARIMNKKLILVSGSLYLLGCFSGL